MKNIRFDYYYLDGENLRSQGQLIFSNPDGMTLGEIEYGIKSRLINSEYFDHSDFMVPSLYSEYPDLEKNPRWHVFSGVHLTSEKANDSRNISDFLLHIK